jgi:uracil-DNA glycosylase
LRERIAVIVVNIGNDWDDLLKEEFQKDYYLSLREFLKSEYRTYRIYPKMHDIFNALKFTSFGDAKAIILGQDPYINENQAHGLAFSVSPGQAPPPSLVNIFKEIASDAGGYLPNNGYLKKWTQQGVMLLNAVLTVRAGKSKSHANKGWEIFTNRIIEILNEKDKPLVFLLWGRDAAQKESLVTNPAHKILKAAHPSPLARGAFFGCRHFSKTNEFLIKKYNTSIDWQIENI